MKTKTITLALQSDEGGKPVRETPLTPDYWGPQFYDEQERQQLTEVLATDRFGDTAEATSDR